MSALIPKTTSPLVKLIRTGEGVLVFASNVALLVVPIATTALSAQQAIKYAVILNGATVVSRTVLKIGALIKPQTGVAPAPLWASTAAEIAALTQTLADLKNQVAALPKPLAAEVGSARHFSMPTNEPVRVDEPAPVRTEPSDPMAATTTAHVAGPVGGAA